MPGSCHRDVQKKETVCGWAGGRGWGVSTASGAPASQGRTDLHHTSVPDECLLKVIVHSLESQLN